MRWMTAAAVLACLAVAAGASPRPRSKGAMTVRHMHVNGVDLAYVEEGTGEVVLFVHGACGDWRSWEPLRPIISARYRYVSLSRRYHHPNAWPDSGEHYSLDQHVNDVAAFIRGLRGGKVHLVGNSYGGRIAGVLALRHPELLRSVVLGEPGVVAPNGPEAQAAMAAWRADLEKIEAGGFGRRQPGGHRPV